MNKTEINKKSIVHFNSHWIYYAKGGTLYRARKARTRGARQSAGSIIGGAESRINLYAYTDSIEKIDFCKINNSCSGVETKRALLRYYSFGSKGII